MGPPAAATLLVHRVPWIMVTAVGIGAASVVVGLLVSYHHDTAAGATMALTAVGCFLLVLVGTSVRRAATSRARPASAAATGS